MVPRGAKLWPLPLTAPMAEAVAVGLKSQAREIINGRNACIPHGEWSQIDWTSAFAQDDHLSARIAGASGRRTTQIQCRIRAGDLFWIKRPDGRRDQETTTLHVRAVRAQRIQEIDLMDARAEGVEVLVLGMSGPGRLLRRAYDALVELMPKRQKAAWLHSEQHLGLATSAITPRAMYAALWELHHGPNSWAMNPWVWVFRFERFQANPVAALKLANNSP